MDLKTRTVETGGQIATTYTLLSWCVNDVLFVCGRKPQLCRSEINGKYVLATDAQETHKPQPLWLCFLGVSLCIAVHQKGDDVSQPVY